MTKLDKNHKQLRKIWQQVPVDYYQNGVKKNLLQFLWHKRKIQVFKKLIGKKKIKSILDIGCASGLMTSEIKKMFPQAKITGIDVYKKAINFARKNYLNIDFIVADAHKLPLKNSSIDFVISYETIEHVTDPIQVLREMKRVVKKDGKALVVMDSGSLLFRIVWWFWEKNKGSVWKGAHLHPFHNHDLEIVIKKAGFKIVKKIFSHIGMEISFLLKK